MSSDSLKKKHPLEENYGDVGGMKRKLTDFCNTPHS